MLLLIVVPGNYSSSSDVSVAIMLSVVFVFTNVFPFALLTLRCFCLCALWASCVFSCFRLSVLRRVSYEWFVIVAVAAVCAINGT